MIRLLLLGCVAVWLTGCDEAGTQSEGHFGQTERSSSAQWNTDTRATGVENREGTGPAAVGDEARRTGNLAEVSPDDVASAARASRAAGRLTPEALVYQGAFRLPEGSQGSNWEYSGTAMTFYPAGDPNGPADDFPGSLFIVGHDHQQMISEVSIPAPVASQSKRIEDLPTARTLQPFADVRGDQFGALEIPRAGIAYLPHSDPKRPGKLHFCWGQHFQFEHTPSHGWCEINLSNPESRGAWLLGHLPNYVTCDYMCSIPHDKDSADVLATYPLATGRFRDGQWGGLGPALIAYRPPAESSAPPSGARVASVLPLLLYGRVAEGAAELLVDPAHRMVGFSESDEWSGVAWITKPHRAVVFVGTKAVGETWYGFADGTVYPLGESDDEEYPEVPAFPFDARGWWSSDIRAEAIFYDPEDLAAVARGELESWEPQPYARLDLTPYLFDPGYDHPRYKRYLLGACCVDHGNQKLYVIERRADEEKSLVHVFRY